MADAASASTPTMKAKQILQSSSGIEDDESQAFLPKDTYSFAKSRRRRNLLLIAASLASVVLVGLLSRHILSRVGWRTEIGTDVR